jgi:colicin import membrane protein
MKRVNAVSVAFFFIVSTTNASIFAQQPSGTSATPCSSASRDRHGKLDLQAFIACEVRTQQAQNQQDLIDRADVRQQAIERRLNSTDARERARGECERANRPSNGRLDQQSYIRCIDERFRSIDAAAALAQKQRLDQIRKDEEAARQKEAEIDAERSKRNEEISAARAQESDRVRAEYERSMEELRQSEAAAAAQERRAIAALKAKCGDDYRRIAVGMNWSRVNECAGPFRAIGEIAVGRDVVASYSSRTAVVSVIGQKVVQWLAVPPLR